MNALFITNKNHLDSYIPGGVQICTQEFIELFKGAGYELSFFKVETTRSYFNRLKIKLGINSYDFYDFSRYLAALISKIEKEEIKLIVINQVNLSEFAKLLKNRIPELKIVVLSHGNESGDYLYEALHPRCNIFKRYKLGKLILKEADYFFNYIDLLVTISDIEKKIDLWLGALNCIYIPRIINIKPLKRKPLENCIGFVGTLNHPPNYVGVRLLASELQKINFKGSLRITGGPEKIGLDLEKEFECIKYVGYLTDDELEEEAKLWTIFANTVFWYSRGVTTKVAKVIGWEIPFITTIPGIRGYEWREGQPLIVKNPREMAMKLVQFLGNEKKQEETQKEIKKIKASAPTLKELSKVLKDSINML